MLQGSKYLKNQHYLQNVKTLITLYAFRFKLVSLLAVAMTSVFTASEITMQVRDDLLIVNLLTLDTSAAV